MTLDTRARQAAQGINRAVEVMEMSTSTQEPRKVERFDRYRDRKQRNRRIGAIAVAAALTAAIVLAAIGTLQSGQSEIPSVGPINAGNVGTMHEIAMAATDGQAFRMAAGDGVLVVGTGAFGAKTGDGIVAYPYPCGGTDAPCEPLWRAEIDDAALPTIHAGIVFARGLQGHRLYAFSTDCGNGGERCTPLWTANIGRATKAPEAPFVAAGQVFVGTTDGVYGFDEVCGPVCTPGGAFHATTSLPVTAIAYGDGELFVGTGKEGPPDSANNGSILTFQAPCPRETIGCGPRWNQEVGQVRSLTVNGGMLFVGTNGHTDGIQAYPTSCARRASCSPTWVAATTCCTTLTATDGFVYAHDHITSTYKFAAGCGINGSTCTPLWRASPLGDPFVDFSPPVIGDGVVFVGGADDSIYAFPDDCSSSCQPAWSTYVGDGSGDEDAVVLDRHLYVAAGDGLHVYAPTDQPEATTSGSTDPVWWITAGLVAAATVGLAIAYVRRRRSTG
jgi:outer membrane protein assembly factor BamB